MLAAGAGESAMYCGIDKYPDSHEFIFVTSTGIEKYYFRKLERINVVFNETIYLTTCIRKVNASVIKDLKFNIC